MSLKAINWMAKQTTGDDKMKSALFWLAFHLNDETGECFPSISTLQAEMEVKSDNTVRGALRRLREAGFISWERETKDGLTVKTNYHLHMNGSMAEGTSASNGTSTIAVPQPLREGTSTVEGGTSTIAGGVLQPVRTNREIEQGINRERNKESSMRTSGKSSAIAAVASAQAQTLPTSFPQSSNSQNHSETKTAGKDSLPNASERSVAAHRDRPDTSDEQTRQNDAGCSQNASTCISVACPENEPPPMSDEDLENLFANAQLEECPPFPEKGDHPSEKDAHLSSGDKKPARKKPATTAFCAVPRPDDVDPQVWSDWMAVRKRKNKPLTETAFNFLKSQAEKAGISTARAIELCAQNGWLGFREEYLRNSFSRNSNSYQPAMKTPIKRKRAEDYVWKVK